MLYVLAAIGALTVAVLMWKAFGPQSPGSPDSEEVTRPGWPGMPGRGSAPKRRQAPIAPDDDPEFLRKLNEQQRKQRDNGDAENK